MIKVLNVKKTAISLLIIASVFSYGKEWVKNGDFEDGKTAPWRLTKPNKNVSLSIVTDSESPCGGTGAFGITMSKEKRIDIIQYVKIGPGKYKLTAYMDTTRCTKPGGYILLYLSGQVNGKWHNFGGVSAGGTPKIPGVGWQKTVWQKYEKIITVPEGGVIKGINISLFSLTGTIMLDGISIQDYGTEEEQKNLEQKQQDEKKKAELKAQQTAAPQGLLQSRKHRNLFRQDETPELGFELKNPADREVSLKVRFTTTDYFGRTVLATVKEFKIPAKGKMPVEIPVKIKNAEVKESILVIQLNGNMFRTKIKIVRNPMINGTFEGKNFKGDLNFGNGEIHLRLTVQDSTDAGPTGKRNVWETDCVELFFDTEPLFIPEMYAQVYTQNTFRIFITPRDGKITAFKGVDLAKCRYSAKCGKDSYTVEFSIPANAGKYLGFECKIDDYNADGKCVSETQIGGGKRLHSDRCSFALAKEK